MVLLHEYFGTGDSWSPQRVWLARMFRVLTPDLRGHGRTIIDLESRIRVSDIAGDIIAMLDELNVQRVHIVGCSLGAVVGLFLARTNPGRVLSLAVESVPDVRDTSAREYAKTYVERVFPRVETSLDRVHGDVPGVRYARSLLLRNFELDLDEVPDDHIRATAEVESLIPPVLVIAGDRDLVCSPLRAINIAEKIPNASLAILPNTGHLVHQEMPGIFNQLVLEHFLSSTSAR